MELSEMKTKLDELNERRSSLLNKIERIKGRKEQGETRLKELEAECKELGVDPEDIEETVAALETRLQKSLFDLEKDMEEAEARMAPFLEKLGL